MARTPDEYAARRHANLQAAHDYFDSFHGREAAKYAAKADQHRAVGNLKAAARDVTVADRNRRKAAERAAKRPSD